MTHAEAANILDAWLETNELSWDGIRFWEALEAAISALQLLANLDQAGVVVRFVSPVAEESWSW